MASRTTSSKSSDNHLHVHLYRGGVSYTKLVQVAGTYYFRVRACNSGPCSGFTAVRTSTVTFVPTKPRCGGTGVKR